MLALFGPISLSMFIVTRHLELLAASACWLFTITFCLSLSAGLASLADTQLVP